MRIRIGLLLLSLLAALPLQADEISDLRAENARLRAQLEAAQKNGQAATVTSATTVAPASPLAITAPPPATAPHASSASPSSVAVPAATPEPVQKAVPSPPVAAETPAVPDAPAAPPGYKLVRVAPLPPSERYMDTGCSRGLFQGPPPAPWNDANNWNGLQRAMTEQQVEALIGTDHHDVTSRGQLQWQYGRCGDSVGGWVLFEDGHVRSWSAPEG